ncbi:MAG: cell division protein FtsQ/DivIB [Flavitalea sp.]
MKRRPKLMRLLTILTWCILGAGVIVLLGAAVKQKKAKTCRGYDIEINGADEGMWFVDKQDIIDVLTERGTKRLRDRKLIEFDLKALEKEISEQVWISAAQLFFDNSGVLKVKVTERQPVARIFSVDGGSYYVDSSTMILPLSDKTITRLPVFTGFPVVRGKLKGSDSLLMRDIVTLSRYIRKNNFWNAQIAQLDIKGNEFEIVPVIGNHLVEFGDATDHEAKFNRLKIFYKQVLANSGMDKYSLIRLQFKEQVVAVKNPGFISKADSLKVMKNIEDMISDVHLQEVKMLDSIAKSVKDSLSNHNTKTTKNNIGL